MIQRISQGIRRRITRGRTTAKNILDFPFKLKRRNLSRRIQQEALQQSGYKTCSQLIIFFIPGTKQVTGGGLQIFTLHRLTCEYFKDSNTASCICWLPGEGWDAHHFDGFNNDITVFPFEMILDTCGDECEIMLHLPEYASFRILEKFGWQRLVSLREKHKLKINILNQNLWSMQPRSKIDIIKKIIPDLTCTVGSPAWATKEERKRLAVPLHSLPTWYYPDDAPWQPYESKSNLMIISPDRDPHRELIIDALRNELPELELRVIQNIPYEQYVELEKSAKWSLTFGEGMDGYFYGPALRGGIPFAVRNATFNIPGYEQLTTVYDSYEIMAKCIAKDIKALDSKDVYEASNMKVRTPFSRLFGREKTAEAIKAFYRGDFTIP